MADFETRAIVRIVDRATPEIRKINRGLSSLKRGLSSLSMSGRGVARISMGMRRMANVVAVARTRIDALRVSMRRLQPVTTRVGRVMRATSRLVARPFAYGWQRMMMVAGGALGAVSFTSLSRAFVSAAAEMERYRTQILAVERSLERARKAEQWILEFTKRTPLNLQDVMRAYTVLRASGIDPMNGSLQALVDTMAHFGMSAHDLVTLSAALAEAWAKGKLELTDLKQFAVRGVPAFKVLAKALGVTERKLFDMIKKGQLARKEIALFTAALGKAYAGGAERLSRTFDGLKSNLEDVIWNFQRMAGEAGPLSVVKSRLQGLLDVIDRLEKTGRLQRIAERVGRFVGALIDAFIPKPEEIYEALTGDTLEKVLSPENAKKLAAAVRSFREELVAALKSLVEVLKGLKRLMEMFGLISGAPQGGASGPGQFRVKRKQASGWLDYLIPKVSFSSGAVSQGASKQAQKAKALTFADQQVARAGKGDLLRMPLESAAQAGRVIAQETANGVVLRRVEIGSAIGEAISSSMKARAAEIGNMIGAQAAARIREAASTIKPVVIPQVPSGGGKPPVGRDAPAPVASQ